MNVVRKALEAEYVASIGDGTAPAKDPILRINPRFLAQPCQPDASLGLVGAYRLIMPGSTEYVTRNVPLTLMDTMSVISSLGVSAKSTGIACDLPTLLTRNSVT